MYRKLIGSIVAMTVCIGLVSAEELTVMIKKVDGNKVTYTKFVFKKKDKDAKDTKAEELTATVARDAKIAKGKTSFKDKKFAVEVGDPIEEGLKNEIFTKIDEKKGVIARITTSEDNKTITQILVVQFGKGKDKKTEKDK